MKMIGKILILIAITMIAFNIINSFINNKNETKKINNYIETTKISESITENNNETKEETNETTKESINYTAILEIPSINLKKGVVNSTKNFNSINYAISVDENSNYPDQNGNFILYAHSGNSGISYFKKLNQVNIDDSVYVYYKETKYHYIINNKYDIKKTGKVNVVINTNNKYITLITCNPNKKEYQTILIGNLIKNSIY